LTALGRSNRTWDLKGKGVDGKGKHERERARDRHLGEDARGYAVRGQSRVADQDVKESREREDFLMRSREQ